uniref:Uncharacterized protein n=1 Tax=Guillardia theta TaxID=55529 RepID=A0A6U5Y5D3_GUITH|mmetsp:Transcript_19886/g.66207  ORF Transcript_19886/g.66207 Transcript_19886/m.66207 type:complete len:278 (+) Transcript_19886:814-1647(+)
MKDLKCLALLLLASVLVQSSILKDDACPSREDRPDSLTHAARTLLKNNQMEQAKACLEKAFSKNPRYVPAMQELGTLCSRLRQYEMAVKYFSMALKEEVTTGVLNNLAIVYQEMGSHTEAVQMYKRALKLDQDDATAHYNLGTALEKAGSYKEAVKSYREAIELEPEEAKYYNNMGGSLAAMNKTETAERSYKWAIKLSPRFIDAYYNIGNLLLATGKIENAIERLEQALKLDPSHAKAQKKLKEAQKALEEKVEAFKMQVDDAIEKAQKMMSRGEL